MRDLRGSRELRNWALGLLGVFCVSLAAIASVEATADDSLWTARVGILGTVATLAGLGVTLRQVARTATAAEASRTAAEDAERRTTAALALSLVDHLLAIDNEMNSAMASSRDEVLRVIRHWRQTAGEVIRLLAVLDPLEREFRRRLQRSIALGTACTHALEHPATGPSVVEFRSAVGAI